jgi:hypothetical protein
MIITSKAEPGNSKTRLGMINHFCNHTVIFINNELLLLSNLLFLPPLDFYVSTIKLIALTARSAKSFKF